MLNSDDPSNFTLGTMDPAEERKQQELRDRPQCFVAPYVVEIEVKPIEKAMCYDRSVQCEIIDSSMVKHL